MVSSLLSPHRPLAAAAATSVWMGSGAAVLSTSAASFSAFARMAVCATKDTLELNAIAPQTTQRCRDSIIINARALVLTYSRATSLRVSVTGRP